MRMLEVRTYKNYKDLCNSMDWNAVGGNFKKAKLKELESMCKYHKDGNKIVIDEIYDIYLSKSDNRKNNGGHNTSKYQEIDIILNNYLALSRKRVIETSLKPLMISLGFVNSNYKFFNEESNKLDINIDTISYFKNSIEGKSKGIIESALNRLVKDNKVIWEYKNIIVRKEENDMIYRVANNEENIIINEYEKYVLKEMGFRDKRDLVVFNRLKEFYKVIHKYLKAEDVCEYYYRKYFITKLYDFKVEKYSDEKKYILNNKIAESILKSAEKKSKNVIKYRKYRGIHIFDEEFIYEVNRLIDNFIYINIYNKEYRKIRVIDIREDMIRKVNV